MEYHFITAIWGDRFIDLLLRVMLPNQMAEGNLGAFVPPRRARYKIYTTERDAARIRDAAAIARLAAILPVEVIAVPGIGETPGHCAAYDDMTRCHQLGIMAAEAVGAAMIFLPGDAIWSEGSFRRLAELAEAGRRAVLVAGIRLVLETYVDAFLARFLNPATGEAKAEARALVAHVLPHLHRLTKSYFLDSPEFISFPSHLIWPVKDRGLLLKGFHLHPALVWPMAPSDAGDAAGTIDYAYLARACPDPDRIHVVEDSDEILQVAVDVADHRSDLLKPNRFTLTRMVEFAKQHAEPFQRRIFTDKLIRIHADGDSPAWQAAAGQANRFAERFRFAIDA